MEDKSENKLAQIVTSWLEQQGYEVYEEVAPWGGGGRRADLVAKRGALIWVIETKKSFNLQSLEQADEWKRYAHFSSIATWESKSEIGIKQIICRKFQVGFITVKSSSDYTFTTERVEGYFNRRANTKPILKMLCEETKAQGSAGTTGHEFFTPFKSTCQKLLRVAEAEPGIDFEDAIKGNHHYKTDKKASVNLHNRIIQGEVPTMYLVQKGKRFLLYPATYPRDWVVATKQEVKQGGLF